MQEFSLIKRYCQDIGKSHSSTIIGIGDDAAVLEVPAGMAIAISVDTMVEGVHFSIGTAPELIAHKLATVNFSDMAAMGAQPKWATLALTLPAIDEQWLKDFSTSLNNITTQYGVQLIGGDTTQGSLCLSMQIMGLLKKGQAITRQGAAVNDDCYVSGTLGDAALALAVIQGRVELASDELKICRRALEMPIPQVELGQRLLNIATAGIDVSDGLVADLGHIATQSGVSMQIDVEAVPLSPQYKAWSESSGNLDFALTGGEDYQLAFTAASKHRQSIEQLAVELNISLSRIGKVIANSNEPVMLRSNSSPYQISKSAGYQHFSKQLGNSAKSNSGEQ